MTSFFVLLLNQMMTKLNLPFYDYQLKNQGQKKYIFDLVKKKFVTLTPEEWVRQHWISYLIEFQNVPKSLIAVEYPLKFNSMQKRADIIAYSKTHIPFVIIECKAPHIKIDEKAIQQVAIYNQEIKAKFIVISNGIEHFLYKCDFAKNQLIALDKLPNFSEW